MTSNCHTFFKKKLQKSVTIWEHLSKRYHFWTIIKQKKEKSVTIWKNVWQFGKKVWQFGKKMWQFEVMDCIIILRDLVTCGHPSLKNLFVVVEMMPLLIGRFESIFHFLLRINRLTLELFVLIVRYRTAGIRLNLLERLIFSTMQKPVGTFPPIRRHIPQLHNRKSFERDLQWGTQTLYANNLAFHMGLSGFYTLTPFDRFWIVHRWPG